MIVNCKAFDSILGICGTVIPRDPHHPILKNVLVQGHGDKVSVTATDGLSSTVVLEIDAIDATETFLVGFAPLSELIRAISKTTDVVTMRVSQNKLTVEDEFAQLTFFPLIDGDTYPLTPTYHESGFCDIDAHQFVNALSLSNLTNRAMLLLSAYHVVSNENGFFIETTDSYVGGRRWVTDVDVGTHFDTVVGSFIRSPLQRMIAKTSTDWKVSVQDGVMVVITDQGTLFANLYTDATYFDLNRYFTTKSVVSVNKEEWLERLRQLSVLRENKIKLTASSDNGAIYLSVESEVGTASRIVSCPECEDIEMHIDLAATRKVLEMIKGDVEIMVEFGLPTIIEVGKDRYFMVGLQ